MKLRTTITCVLILGMGAHFVLTPDAKGYVLNRTVGSAGGCPQLDRHRIAVPGGINRRWIAVLPTNPKTVFTMAADGTQARIQEVEDAINASFDVWASVGASLTAGSFAPLQRISSQSNDDCNFSDNRNTICFAEEPSNFASGVLAFTRVATNQSSSPGDITDADILFQPNSSSLAFATRGALSSSQFDLESVATHEIGHFLGFSHSAILRAMMYPFAPPKGTFTGERPSQANPSAPLAEDDRAGLRVLYPNPADTVNIGSISGRVLPANPLSLAALPPVSPGGQFTGIFGAHVVAVDADTGAVVAGTFGGWACSSPSEPPRFDGTYVIEGLPINRSYKLFVEPLDGPTDSTNISVFLDGLCRSGVPNSCTLPTEVISKPTGPVTVPVTNRNFTTKVKP
jgi:hypothetical protein